MKQHTTIARNALGLFATVALTLGLTLSPNQVEAQPANVSIAVTADNEYAVFYFDPNTSQYTLAGGDTDWFNGSENYTFSTLVGTYIYVAGRNIGLVAMFASKTNITVGSQSYTILTGVANPNTNWEVNELFRQNNFTLNDATELANWSTSWEAPVRGRQVDQRDPHKIALAGAYHIWKSPGGGNNGLPWEQWGFSGDAGVGTALFRLQVVPEPASMLALSAGLAGLVGLRRRRKA